MLNGFMHKLVYLSAQFTVALPLNNMLGLQKPIGKTNSGDFLCCTVLKVSLLFYYCD